MEKRGGLANDLKERKTLVADGKLGFDMPKMAPELVRQLLNGGYISTTLPGIDPRYAPKR